MASRSIVTTISLSIIAALVVALTVGFAEQANTNVFYPPTPLLLASSKTYEAWLAYHYAQQYLSLHGYTLDEESYRQLLGYVAQAMQGSRSMVYNVYGTTARAVVYNLRVEQMADLQGLPEYLVVAAIYLPSEKALVNATLTVYLPIRYHVTEELLLLVASLPNGSTAEEVESAVTGYLDTLEDVWVTLTIHSTNQTSSIGLTITDCYLKEYYGVCPTYLGSELVDKTLPNLTLSLSSSTQPEMGLG